MGVKFSGELFNGLSVRVTHEPSGAVIETTPPVDNGGDGSKFSPTDMCAASLGTCATTIMALYAKNHGIPLNGVRFRLEKNMQAAPRRLAQIIVHYEIDTSAHDLDFQKLVGAAKACPVRLSLRGEVEVKETFSRPP